MKVEVIPANSEDEHTMRHLYQFYMYEFSTFMGWDVGYTGLFAEDDLDGCWTDKTRHPFLIRADGQLAGLAIVDYPDKRDNPEDGNVAYMAEFFVMGAYQKRGVGEQAAVQLFDMFPGKWEVSELAQNVNAQAFWRKIIGRYTSYEENTVGERKLVVQTFDNSHRATS